MPLLWKRLQIYQETFANDTPTQSQRVSRGLRPEERLSSRRAELRRTSVRPREVDRAWSEGGRKSRTQEGTREGFRQEDDSCSLTRRPKRQLNCCLNACFDAARNKLLGRSLHLTGIYAPNRATRLANSGLSRTTPSPRIVKSAGRSASDFRKPITARSTFGRSGSIKSKTNAGDETKAAEGMGTPRSAV